MRTLRRKLNATLTVRRALRYGLTLPELLCATTILTILAGAMGTLAYGIGNANDHCQGYDQAAQHARIALERIRGNVIRCKTSESFPGCMVASTAIGSYSFPDRLLIWKSNGVSAGEAEYPRRSDLIVYTYNPNRPVELLEITTTDTTQLTSSSQSALNAVVDAMLSSPNSTKTVVTDRLHIASPTNSLGIPLLDLLADTSARGLVRFRILMSPTASQWSDYKLGLRSWGNIDWPLDEYGTGLGTRRISCQTELQMLSDDTGDKPPIPFFGSATNVSQLAK